jgi:hypothetical protein
MSDVSEHFGPNGGTVLRHNTRGSAPEERVQPSNRVIGGVTRMGAQTDEPSDRAAPLGPSSQVHGGTFRHSPRSGEAESVGTARHNSADEIGSAHNARGGPVSRITGADFIKHGGMSIPAGVAEGMGLLERTPEGDYKFPGEAQSPKLEAPAPTPDAETVGDELPDEFGLEANEVKAYESVAGAVREQVLEAFAETVIQVGASGGDGAGVFDSVTGSAIRNAGLDGHATAVIQGLQRNADAVVTARGVDPIAFYNYARHHDGKALTAAMREHLKTGDARVYVPLVDRFKRGRNV